MNEPFRVVASFGVVDACFKSEGNFDKVNNPAETPLKGSCDMFMHEDFHSLGFDSILPNPLNHSHASPLCSLPSHSLEYYIDVPISNPMFCNTIVDLCYAVNIFSVLGANVDCYVSLGYTRGYDFSIDSYCVCLENLPRKVMWTTFFNSSYDFFKGFDKVKRILIVFGVILVITFYLPLSKLWS